MPIGSAMLMQWKENPNLIFTDYPIEMGKTPTEAHSGLKHLIDALVEEIREDASLSSVIFVIFTAAQGDSKKLDSNTLWFMQLFHEMKADVCNLL